MQNDNLDRIRARYYDLMLNTINSIYQDNDLESRISGVLDIIGEFMRVSRVYVFEDDFESKISKNTYEWCAKGVEPQIDMLQNVPHEVMGTWHDMLHKDGIIKAYELKELPVEIYDQLCVQGIISILVLPLYKDDRLYGYVGFDECREARVWNDDEIRVLRALSSLFMGLVARYDAEQEANASRRVLHTVLDNIDTPIYATDPTTSRILFANRRFSEGLACGNAVGKICWEIVREDMTGECDFCPRKKLIDMNPGEVYNWEVYNSITEKWYYCTDRLIEWTDGKTAHLQSALDITARKEYEDRLKFSATYDKMTGIYNRESGLRLLEEMMSSGKREGFSITFCFLDVDGLKRVNDVFGHIEGDRLITSVTDAIRSVIRSSDIFARLGGDEFMLALRACPRKNAGIMLGKINRQLDKLNSSGDYPYELSVSVGMIEITPGMELVLDDVLMEADKLMYEDKNTKNARRE